MPFADSDMLLGMPGEIEPAIDALTHVRERVARADDPVALAFCLYYLASAVATARR